MLNDCFTNSVKKAKGLSDKPIIKSHCFVKLCQENWQGFFCFWFFFVFTTLEMNEKKSTFIPLLKYFSRRYCLGFDLTPSYLKMRSISNENNTYADLRKTPLFWKRKELTNLHTMLAHENTHFFKIENGNTRN